MKLLGWEVNQAQAMNGYELKNVSSEEINMDGWQLLDKDNQIKIIFNSSDILSANSFYLLERMYDFKRSNIQEIKYIFGCFI
jgi:hypothetical protein